MAERILDVALRRRIEGALGRGALQLPVGLLAQALEPAAGQLLLELAFDDQEPAIELLRDEYLLEDFRPGQRSYILTTLRSALIAWAERGHAAAPKVSKAPKAPRVADDHAMKAAALGVEDALEHLADGLVEYTTSAWQLSHLAPVLAMHTVGDVLRAKSARGVPFNTLPLLRDAAERYLAALGQTRKRWAAARAAAPELPARVAPTIEALKAWLPEAPPSRPSEVTTRILELDAAAGTATLGLRLPHSGFDSVCLSLSSRGEAALPTLDCTCEGACRHEHPVAEALLLALTDLAHPHRRALQDMLTIPGWVRQLDALARAFLAEAPGEEVPVRLAWRVELLRGALGITPALQKRRSGGGWTKGSKLSVMEASRSGGLEEADRRALGLLQSSEWVSGVLQGLALQALVGHPRVVHAVTGEALAVEAGRLEAHLEETQEGLQMALRLGGRRLGPEELEEGRVLLLARRFLVWIRGAVCVVAEGTAAQLLAAEGILRYASVIPADKVEALGPLVAPLQRTLRMAVPPALLGTPVEADRTVRLRARPEGEGLALALVVRPLPDHSWAPGDGPAVVVATQGDARVAARRDLEAERAEAERLRAALGMAVAGSEWVPEDLQDGLQVLRRAQELEVAVEWPDTRGWSVGRAGVSNLKVRVSRGPDWFQVEGEVEVDGAAVSLAALIQAARAGQRFVRLGPGRFAQLEEALQARSVELADQVFTDHRGLGAGLGALEAVERLAEAGAEVARDEAWARAVARMSAARDHQPQVPKALQADLRDYQREGFGWLSRLAAWGAGACLADEMGLGKTVQAIAALLERAPSGPQLVVAPTSVGPSWMEELTRFAPSLDARLYRGPERAGMLAALAPGQVLVTSYDILALDAELWRDVPLATLVLDEAQAVKNSRTQRARAVRGLQADWRLALTGTPVENHLGDLWSLFDVVSPGLLGTWDHFRARFAAPIEKDGDPVRRAALARLVRPFVLRRTKAQVALELPPRTEVTRLVTLSHAERAHYEAARREAVEALAGQAGEEQARFQILAALTKLRRLACHPRLVVDDPRVGSAKLEACLELVDGMVEGNERALIFSQFTGYLALLRAALDARGLAYLYLDGSTPATARGELVRQWQQEAAPFFLISLKAGGTGLNLVGADYVLHLDPWWNPAVEDQATDRTHRIGQTKPVTVVRLVAEGTIEQAVLGLHAEKRALAAGVLEGSEVAARLSTEALMDLVRWGEDAPEPEPEAEDGLTPAALEAHLGALVEALGAHVQEGRVAEGTAQAYARAYQRLLTFARTRPGEALRLEAWVETYGAAVAAGYAAPRSDPKLTRTALRRVGAL